MSDVVLGVPGERAVAAPTAPRHDDPWTILVLLGVAAAWNLVGNLWLPDAWYVPANLAAAAAVALVGRRARLSAGDLGLHPSSFGRGARLGLVAVGVVAAALAVVLAVPWLRTLLQHEFVAADSTSMRWFRPAVRIPLGTVVFEELLFRSVLYGLVLRRWGSAAAVLATAGLFGLWHVVPAWETAEGDGVAVAGAVIATVVATSVGGVVFALLRRRSGSVLAPALAHTATNSLSYVAASIASAGIR